MKIYLLLISVWGYNGTHWEYTGNQYVMKEYFTFEECQALINEDNWKRHENNVFSNYPHLLMLDTLQM